MILYTDHFDEASCSFSILYKWIQKINKFVRVFIDRFKIQINNINIHIFIKNKSARSYLSNDNKTQYGSTKEAIPKSLNPKQMDPEKQHHDFTNPLKRTNITKFIYKHPQCI